MMGGRWPYSCCFVGCCHHDLLHITYSGRWPYSCCFVGCCPHDLLHITYSILVQLPSSFFSIRLVSVHVVHPYTSIGTTAAWKKLLTYFNMTDSLSIAIHVFASRALKSFSVDETLLPR